MYNYKSPIETTMLRVKSDLERSLEDTVYKAVVECGVTVNKDELIKALAYDRGEYDKGYGDGYKAAKAEIVRCSECVHKRDWYIHARGYVICGVTGKLLDKDKSDDFCSRGKREAGNEQRRPDPCADVGGTEFHAEVEDG